MATGNISPQIQYKLTSIVSAHLNPIMAPARAEKYTLSANQLIHLQKQQNALFMEENRQQVKDFVVRQVHGQPPAVAETPLRAPQQQEIVTEAPQQPI